MSHCVIRNRAWLLTVTKAITLEEILTAQWWAVPCCDRMHCGQVPITLLPSVSAPPTQGRSSSCRGIHCARKMGPIKEIHGMRKYSWKGDRQILSPTQWREVRAALGSIYPVYIQSEYNRIALSTPSLTHPDGTGNAAVMSLLLRCPWSTIWEKWQKLHRFNAWERTSAASLLATDNQRHGKVAAVESGITVA